MAMGNCRLCLRYKQVDEQSHICARCTTTEKNKVRLSVRLVFCDGKIRIEDAQDRKIISKNEWFDIKRYIDAYYYTISQDEIDEINARKEEIAKSRRQEPRRGYIYLMISSNGYYKIGRGKNVEIRKTGHARDYPLEIKVLHSFYTEDCVRAETHLLRMFREKKLQGEWFALEKADVDFITSITDEIAQRLF